MEVIILAGGLGTRLRALVTDRPKPMADINGKPFLQYLLDFWISHGATHIILSVGYQHQKIIDYFGTNYQQIKLSYAIEQQPLGTGGGLALALAHLTNLAPCVIQNGDTFFNLNPTILLDFHRTANADFTVALRLITKNSRYSPVKLNAAGKVVAFLAPNQATDVLINGGVYVVNPTYLQVTILHHFKGEAFSLEHELLPQLINHHENIYAKLCEGYFVDIGIPDDYHRAVQDIASTLLSY